MTQKLLLLKTRNININTNPKPKENIISNNNKDASDKDQRVDTMQSQMATSMILYRQKLHYVFTNQRTRYRNIGIHNKDPNYVLDISGNLRVTKEVLINGDISGTSNLNITGDISGNGKLNINGAITGNSTMKITGDISGSGLLNINGNITTASDYYINSYLFMPVGTIIQYVVSSAPTGWLSCDGTAVSRSTYSRLYNIIGDTFGAGNGSTTFNLPDFRGRVGVGIGTGSYSGATSKNMAQTGGAETHTLSTSEIPAHTHSGTTSENGSHTHTHNANNAYPGAALVYRNGENTRQDADDGQTNEINLDTSVALTIDSAGAHTHTFTTDNGTGGGAAHNIMQPFIAINYIIRY